MNVKLYQNLGKLFYSVASADQKVNEAEANKLKEIIKKHWLDLDDAEDQFGSDAAYQIEIIFDELNANDNLQYSQTFYNDFVTYKNEQPHLFTNKLNKLIMKTANEIAQSFAGKNKSELIILAKLNLELKKL